MANAEDREIMFENLINRFMLSDQLGSYDMAKFSITLPNQLDSEEVINDIREKVGGYTKSFKLVKRSIKNGRCNIKILDIGL